MTTGVRRGELLALRWQDVHLGGATIEVAGTKTNASRRSVDLDPETVAVLRTWKRTQAEVFLGIGAGRADRVFTIEDGRPVTPKNIWV